MIAHKHFISIFIVVFLVFLHILIRQEMTLRKKSGCPLLILSIISIAFAVCIPKKIHRISAFLFRAFILESE